MSDSESSRVCEELFLGPTFLSILTLRPAAQPPARPFAGSYSGRRRSPTILPAVTDFGGGGGSGMGRSQISEGPKRNPGSIRGGLRQSGLLQKCIYRPEHTLNPVHSSKKENVLEVPMPGRNDPCPCGSGKKFKKCCVDTYVAKIHPPSKRKLALEAKALQAKEKELSKPKLQFKPGFDQQKVNAYHEAGHAVFGELLGSGVEITTIDPQKVLELTGRECPGYTRYAGPDGQKAELITIMCLTLAGLTSEATYATNGIISPKEDDLQQAEAVLDQAGLHGPAKEQEYLRYRVVTQEMVKKYRAEIEIVGNALAERKTLTGEDVRSLVMSVSQKS